MNEIQYSDVLTCIAMGMSVEETRRNAQDGESLPWSEMLDVRKDAERQGVEREDIDPSWYR